MPYSIVESKAQAFIDETLKLPRYQRKQTWGPEDNFKLCISIFKGYPIGVVIINYNNDEGFLLDGRQRKNALTLMKEDPILLYMWAKKGQCGENPVKKVDSLHNDRYIGHSVKISIRAFRGTKSLYFGYFLNNDGRYGGKAKLQCFGCCRDRHRSRSIEVLPKTE
jgi:hypothetical protein